MMMGDTPPGMTDTLEQNIRLLSERRRSEAREAPWTERLAGRITAFTGSMTFVAIHLVVFGGWIVWNLWFTPKFDPSFVTLAMVASVESIFLSTFVLISQNRAADAADARADLDLHINLLTEHELSKLTSLVARVAERLDLDPRSPDLAEIEEDIQPGRVLDALAAQAKPD